MSSINFQNIRQIFPPGSGGGTGQERRSRLSFVHRRIGPALFHALGGGADDPAPLAQLLHAVSAPPGHAGEAGEDAPARGVPQSPLHIIFFIELPVNVGVFVPLTGQLPDLRRNAAIGAALHFFLRHRGSPLLLILQF